MSIRIITDSGSDIVPELAKELNVEVIPLKTYFGEEEYIDGVTLNHTQFFEKLIETDVFPTTSQVTPFEYDEKFAEVAAAGDTAIVITVSSKLSGCYSSANIAAADYDSIYIVDSLNVTVGQRLLVELAVRMREEGVGAEDLVEILNREKKNIRVVALLDTLEYLKKGGRISAAAAMAGTLLSIKPVVAVVDGEVVMMGKARGSKKGNNILNQLIEKEGGINFGAPYGVAYSGLSDTLLKKYLKDSLPIYEGKVDHIPVTTIGCVIGTHVGPGAIAASFFVN